MIDKQVIEETLRYLADETYSYAILIDGAWGCGKTFFVQNLLKEAIEQREQESESPRKFKYISLYGCKSIEDIQENIIWTFAEEAKNSLANNTQEDNSINQVSSNLLLSSRKIGDAILKKFAPGANTFDMASNWIQMQSYILLFDDIERCDCPLNELFGFINGLVEHEGVKVILVANEKEISVQNVDLQKELQYSLVLNDKIQYPEEVAKYFDKENGKVSLEKLEEVRQLLFAEEEIGEKYRKIREKLIGVTLHYHPNIKTAIKTIIQNSNMNSGLKEVLWEHMDDFYMIMDANEHYNLRTFQFFLSKMSYLYVQFNDIDIEDEYREEALSFLVQDCLTWAVLFKGDLSTAADAWEREKQEAKRKLFIVKKYVETGELDKIQFENDIKMYVESELKNNLPGDDPLMLLEKQYYLHPQSWCESKLQEIKQKLQSNKYPMSVYSKIIILINKLVDFGFPEGHLADVKEKMLVNIYAAETPVKLSDDLYYIDDEEQRQKIKRVIDELNLAVVAQDKRLKQQTIQEILSNKDWIKLLEKYTTSDEDHHKIDIAFFTRAQPHQWVLAISTATIEDIDLFRHWVAKQYSSTANPEVLKADLPILKGIADGIRPEEEKDLIKRVNLLWLKEQIGKIVEANGGV